MKTPRVVFTDANVLINLALVDRLDLLGSLAGFEFVVPAEALEEIRKERERASVKAALGAGYLRKTSIEDLKVTALLTELRQFLGAGESACLALAKVHGGLVASDEKRRFLREARRLLGAGSILNTPGLFVFAIRAGLMTILEADEVKELLEQHRFRMTFRSFQDFL